jgi:hypothetical protein
MPELSSRTKIIIAFASMLALVATGIAFMQHDKAQARRMMEPTLDESESLK